jgi:hypothetical protein
MSFITRFSTAVVVAAAIAGCDIGGSTRNRGIPEQLPATFTSTTGTLEHRVTVEQPSIAPDEPRIISISSVVENKGALSHHIITRICAPQTDDLSSADGVQFIALDPPCEEEIADTLDLEPGQKTETIFGRFQLMAGPGLYTIRVRQLLSPNSGTDIQVRMR